MKNRILVVFLYALAFVLLREWLVLMTEMTETGYLSLFLLFVGISFILYLFNVKWPIAIVLKSFYVLWVIQWIYLKGTIFSLDVISYVVQSITSDVPMMLQGELGQVSNVFRTLLFFLFIWMLTYLIRYWIEVKQRLFLFYFTTIVLIATADTFSTYSAEQSIFIVMIVGLLLLGLLMAYRLNRAYEQSFSARQFVPVVVPLLFLLVMSSIFVSFLPKYAPIWADPVPFIQAVVDENTDRQSTVSKSGYDPSDEQLGGPFIEDDSLVFEAIVDEKRYWKVETKDTYTSKGWEQSRQDPSPVLISQEGYVKRVLPDAQLGDARLSLAEEFPFIIHPYGLLSIQETDDVMIYYDQFMDHYKTVKNENQFPLNYYELSFEREHYSLKQLRNTSVEAFRDMQGVDRYLQLPDTLPERVTTLAQSITASSDSVYDKAKAVERYFQENDYTYERTNVAVPTSGDDYVDQFLFDTKKGYCDNFSSSMVVMLRTLDIPARWVKGFAPGERSRNEGGEDIYRVSNNEAHSWVEVYMPEIGWMPFEPTIGFNGVSEIDYDIVLSEDDPAREEMPEEELDELENEQIEKEEERQTADEESRLKESKRMWTYNLFGLIFGAFVIGISVLIYLTRKKWIPQLLIRRARLKEKDWATFSMQYQQLLKQLQRLNLSRAPNETLSTYATRVDLHFGSNQMERLTTVYEQGIYGEVEEGQDWQQLQEMWEDLIKRTSD